MDATNLIDRMKRDHERVLRDVAELLEAPDGAPAARPSAGARELARVLAMLEHQFRTHMAAEDRVLYPAIARALPASASSLEPLRDDHAELRVMLQRLQALVREPGSADHDEQVRVQIHDLADLLRLHIRKEESLVFPVAARLLATEEIDAVLARLNAEASGAAVEPGPPAERRSPR